MDEPIAIIGLDSRLPGEGDTPERFYESLLAGRSARTEVPPERYNADAFWHPDAERSGAGSIAAFDAPFFSITPTEAGSMDPQQRGMLECVYKALENAGIPLATAAGSQTGVYVGCFSADYNEITVKDLDMPSKYAATGTVASMLSNRVSWFFDFRGPSVTIDTACSSSLVAAHEACMSLKLREISMAVVGGCNLILTPEMTLKLDAAGVLGPDGKSKSFDHKGNGYARGEGFGALVLKRVSDAVRDGDVIRAVIRNSSSNQDGRSPGITQPTKAAQAALIRHVYAKAGLDPSFTRFFEAHGTGTAVGDPIEASAISEIFTPYRSAEEPLYVGALKSNVGHLEGAAGVAAMIKGVFTLERGIIPANAWFETVNPKIDEAWHLKFPTQATAWPQAGLRRMSINSFGVGGSNAHLVMDDALHFLQMFRLYGSHRTDPFPREELVLDATLLNTNGVNGNGLTNDFNPNLENGLNGNNGIDGVHKTNGANGAHKTNGTTGTNGVNGHKEDVSTGDLQVFTVSSYDQEGVFRVRDSLNAYVTSRSADLKKPLQRARFLKDLGHTLTAKRTHHAWRSFCTASSPDALRQMLTELPPPVRAKSEPRLAFVFTGQGAQWPAMGVELMAFPVFQESFLAADRYLNNLGCSWSLAYELSKDKSNNSRIDDPEFCQPICTALQVALVDLLASWNIHPHAVTGHSSGEVAAAYAAGAITQQAAWKISYFRGKLSAKLARSGSQPKTGMAAVGLSLEEAQASIGRVDQVVGEGTLEVACMNSWNSQTISGDAAKVGALVEMLSSEKKFARRLNVEMAYHSQYMQPMAAEYLESMGHLEPGTREAPLRPTFYSSTLATPVPLARLQDAAYWVENLVSSVRFCESVTQMLTGDGVMPKVNGHKEDWSPPGKITDILEIGPHSALKGPLSNIFKASRPGETVGYHSVLKRQVSGVTAALEAAGSLYCQGLDVDLAAVNSSGDTSGRRPLMLTDLPSYPFNHAKEYWVESRRSREFRLRPVARHELLGAPVLDWNKDNAVWRNYIRLSENPWVEDHKVAGEILYPAAGMLVMAIEASRQLADKARALKAFRFRDVSFHAALRVPDDALGIESHFCLRPHRETSLPVTSPWTEFQLSTFEDGQWREHCRGLIQTEYEADDAAAGGTLEDQMVQELCDGELSAAEAACTARVATDRLYRHFQDSGLGFGPTFRTLTEVRTGPEFKALVRLEPTVDKIKEAMPYQYMQPHLVHPATLDGVIQANLAPLVLGSKGVQQPRVPIFARELWVSASLKNPPEAYTVLAQPRPKSRSEVESSLTAVSAESGKPVAYASGLVFKTLPGGSTQETPALPEQAAYNIEWKPDPSFLSEQQATQAFGLPMVEGEDPSDWMEDCEALCFLYIRDFLDSISQSRDSVDGMDWHHKRYVSWMEHVVSTAGDKYAAASITELEDRVQQRATPEGRLIMAVGRALRDVLGGTRDPLDVIFGDKIAENVYRHGLGSQRCYAQLCSYVDALAHKDPAMRILEIGAGTGGATRPVVETLSGRGGGGGPRYRQYDFTDISPSFFEQAKENFQDELGRMGFRVLNVERDPLEQGFAAGTYDLVLAANVLHATKNIDVSLAHARSLLKPGGKLLLFEITFPEVLLGTFCFGVLPGWWLSEDEDRVWGPLMSPEGWRKHLVASGFTGLEAVFDDFPGSAHHMSSILVSGVPQPEPAVEPAPSTLILVDEASPLQKEVAESLSATISQNGPCEISTMAAAAERSLAETACIVLVEIDGPVLDDMTELLFQSVKKIITESKSLVWLTRGGNATTSSPDTELVTGLARVARSERPDFKFATVSFEQDATGQTIAEMTKQILLSAREGKENSFRVANGMVHVARLVKANYMSEHIRAQTGAVDVVEARLGADPGRRLALQIGTLGQLDTLRFEDDADSDVPLADDEVEFRTMACGLSSRDVASALGKTDETPLGFEASGIVTRTGASSKFAAGDRVFGLCFAGAIKTHARSSEGFLAKLPDSLSWTDAASLPLAYMTAYSVLHETGSIRRRDTILIHSAASAVGQAAIHFAQLQGAEVFATVGSDEKRDFLHATYGIAQDHIFSSRDLSYKIGVKRMTGGRGVDLAIAALVTGDVRDTWDCVAPFGRLVEIGLGEGGSHGSIPTGSLSRNVRFETFDLRARALLDPARTQTSFQRMVAVLNSTDATSLRTPVTLYPLSRLQDAFRHLQSGQHIGKVVLEPRDEDVVPVLPSRKPASQFDPAASYVVAGGLGGLGRSVARWMASRGAKNLILLSRRGPVGDAAKELVAELESLCDKVATPACDVADADALKAAIDECMTHMPPVKGCIQGSMVLRDNLIEHMSLDEWNGAVRPKVQGSRNLHAVLGQGLDFFLLLSSTVGITGNPEQANYAAGGAFQDAFARQLASRGLHSVSLDLPIVCGAGFVAEKPELMSHLQASGWASMAEDELHAALDHHCRPAAGGGQPPAHHAQVLPRFWMPQETAAEGYQPPAWAGDALFSHLAQRTGAGPAKKAAAKKEVSHASLLAAAESREAAERAVLEALLLKMSRVLSVDVSNLDPARPLHAYGIDSLVAVELRSWLAKELRAEVSVFDITNKPSIQQLAAAATERSKLTPRFGGS